MTEHGPDIDIEAMATIIRETRMLWHDERRSGLTGPQIMVDGRALERLMAQNVIAARDAQWQQHIAALEAAAAAFDASLSEYCDGPERDVLRTLLATRAGADAEEE